MTALPRPRRVTPRALAEWLDGGDRGPDGDGPDGDRGAPLLVDVREPWERELAVLPGSVSLPLGEIPARAAELPRDRDVVLVCHHGVRSLQAAEELAARGHERVADLEGGIDAWSLTVDPRVPRY